MATLKEQDIVLLDYDDNNNPIIQMPITRVENVEGLEEALDEKQPIGNYSEDGHGHKIADVSGLQSALNGKQAAGSYASASHGHGISDVSGLQNALDGKQAKGSYVKTVNGTSPDSSGNVKIDVPKVDTSALVPKSGNRGSLAGWSNLHVETYDCYPKKNSPDDILYDVQNEDGGSILLRDGDEGETWVKTILVKSNGYPVRMTDQSDNWYYENGSPAGYAFGNLDLLVFAWYGSYGVFSAKQIL